MSTPETQTPIPASTRITIAFVRASGAGAAPHVGQVGVSSVTPLPHARHGTRLMLAPPRTGALRGSARLGAPRMNGAYRARRDAGNP